MLEWFASETFSTLWAIVWRNGIYIGLIICAFAWAYFMPIFKKTALWVALGLIIGWITFNVGVHLGEQRGAARVQADWDSSLKTEVKDGTKAGDDAVRDVARRPPDWMLQDRYNRLNRPKSEED